MKKEIFQQFPGKVDSIIRDPKGQLMSRFYYFFQDKRAKLSTAIVYYNAWIWGVELKSSNRFYGLPLFYRNPDSKISIGASCIFRSSYNSNLVGINRPCGISTHSKKAVITIGSLCGFSGTIIASNERIDIGNHVLCGANVTITDFDWHSTDPLLRHLPGRSNTSPIVIEDNVWIGMNSLVLKGVHIGRNSVIGANSVVTKDVPANVIAAGNPAIVIRNL